MTFNLKWVLSCLNGRIHPQSLVKVYLKYDPIPKFLLKFMLFRELSDNEWLGETSYMIIIITTLE